MKAESGSFEFTKEDAINRFREMWAWISAESRLRYRKVYKEEYFKLIGVDIKEVNSGCFLCEYAYGLKHNKKIKDESKCVRCPIDFGNKTEEQCNCCKVGSPYEAWQECDDTDWKHAAIFAKMVSELPEKVVKEC